jgi:hypothetical protein
MSNYVFSFRGARGQTADAEQEAAWGKWLGEIGPKIVDAGNRVGRATAVGDTGSTVLSGYIVISADTLDAALEVAKGCPGLAYGGAIEVGEPVPAP